MCNAAAQVLSAEPSARVFVVEEFISEEEQQYLLGKSYLEMQKFRNTGETGIAYEMPIDDDAVLQRIAERQYQMLGATARAPRRDARPRCRLPFLAVTGFSNKMGSTFRVRRYLRDKYHPLHTGAARCAACSSSRVWVR